MTDKPKRRYQVTEAGENTWKDIDAVDARSAGELWAEAQWEPEKGSTTYELDVKAPNGKLYDVTVDVEVDVSFTGFSQRHPCDIDPDEERSNHQSAAEPESA